MIGPRSPNELQEKEDLQPGIPDLSPELLSLLADQILIILNMVLEKG